MLRLFPIWNDNNERFISCNESGTLQFDLESTKHHLLLASFVSFWRSTFVFIKYFCLRLFNGCPKVISGRTGTEVIRLQIIPSLQCSKQTRYFFVHHRFLLLNHYSSCVDLFTKFYFSGDSESRPRSLMDF